MAEQEFLCRLKPYIQPFERELALRELEARSHSTPISIQNDDSQSGDYRITTHVNSRHLLGSLAYWESITNHKLSFTTQVLREATVNIARNGITPQQISEKLPFASNEVPLPNRRHLRYGSHGIHEYRGKFFPQLVRALINIADVPKNGVVLDPMSGSGTTAVEAILLGCRARGLDMNPLSVLMSRTKCGLLSVNPDKLAGEYLALRKAIAELKNHQAKYSLWFLSLPAEDQNYLTLWFAPEVLNTLDVIATHIKSVKDGTIKDYFTLVLSNILRGVSWQKIDDLRVRKEVKPTSDYDPIGDFISELDRSTKTVLAFLYNEHEARSLDWQIQEGDARQSSKYFRQLQGRTDVVITSPPYAMALPYLDTDRLSLCYFGLLTRPLHRNRDLSMIGNREVTEAQRDNHWKSYEENKARLPLSSQRLIETVYELNLNSNVGFRRRNLPALLGKYFFDMQDVFSEIKLLLRLGGCAFVVIGNNHTVAGGQRVDIDTTHLLGELGETVGLRLEEVLPMDMLLSRDIFRKNAVASENILCFRRI